MTARNSRRRQTSAMDSITQAALGAMVGEAVAGRRIGNRALMWGAVAGTLPDLDIFASFFVNDVSNTVIAHRGITHSFVLAPFAAWVLAWIAAKIRGGGGLTMRLWFQLFLWCFATHIVLDLCNSYGTQILQPLSDRRFALSMIYVVDLFYTLPLLAGIVWLSSNRRSAATRRRVSTAVLSIAGLYLVAAFTIKSVAFGAFEEALATREEYRRMETFNTPSNIVLWRMVAVTDDGYWSGWFSLLSPFDGPVLTKVKKHPERARLDRLLAGSADGARLSAFANGYYRYVENDRQVDWINLSMASGDFFPFRFRVAQRENGELRAVPEIRRVRTHARPSMGEILRDLLSRL